MRDANPQRFGIATLLCLVACSAEGSRQFSMDVDASTRREAGRDVSTPLTDVADVPDAPDSETEVPDARATDALGERFDALPDSDKPKDAGQDTPEASAESGTDAHEVGSDVGASADASPAYTHTIQIDGTKDFSAEEEFPTSTVGHSTFVSYDAQYLYFAMQGPSISEVGNTKWLVAYFGTSTQGTTKGLRYNTQEPSLPFAANFELQWKTDNTSTKAMRWNGSAWEDATWDFSGKVFQSGSFVEFRVPLADLGSPSTVRFHTSLLNEGDGQEFTWAGAPSTSFADSYNPSYTRFFEFDLRSPLAPSRYLPKP